MLPDTLRLLGAFELVHHGEPMSLSQPRLEELLAMLAVRPGAPLTRVEIAYHFWPDSSEAQSRTNTRNLLYKLRTAWPNWDEAVTIDRSSITWRQDAAVSIDVHRFESLQASAEKSQSGEERARLLAAAADGYRGDFLPGCYSDWALATREQLRARQQTVLEQLFDVLLDLRRYDEALSRAQQLRTHDPLHESAYRRLMQVYATLDDRAAAVRVYHDCTSILRKELGVEPSSATQKLHAQLLHRVHDRASSPEGLQPIQRPRLVGRHSQWQQLRQAWQDAETGNAQCVLIWGEAGIGKTRLAEEIVDWVRRQGYAWASSRSYAARGALAYAPISEWLRSSSIQPVLATIDDLWRVELARLLPVLLSDRPDLPAPGPLTETWQQQRFFQSIAHTLQAVPGPLILHLDDMQWSDQETLTLLQFLLYVAHNQPLLIIGTIRTEDAIDNASLTALVEGLKQSDQLTEIHLQPLSHEEVAELAEQTAKTTITSKMAESLYAASEGHPLYLIETVRGRLHGRIALQSDSASVAPASQQDGGEPIPPKIYSLISSRLGQLSPMAQQVASTAAVIGRDFTYQVLQWTISTDELSLIDALDELWSRRLVREQAGDSYDFSHDLIREVAYRGISRARRRLLHRRIIVALEAIHSDDIDSVAGELAAHCVQAGNSESACQYYRQAAKISITQHALPDAEAQLDAALAHAPDDPIVRFELLAEQNVIFYSTIQLERWRSNLDEQKTILASLPDADPRLVLDLDIDRSHYFSSSGAGKESVEAARSALDIAEKLDDKAALARAYQELGLGYWAQSRMAEAKPMFGHAVHYAREVEDGAIEGTSLEMHAASGMFSGMPTAQIFDLVTQAYQLAEANGDKARMAILLNKFGYLRISSGMGGFDTAENDYEQGLALAREVGDRRTEGILLSNVGVSLTNRGDYRRALETFNACLALGEAHPTYWRHLVSRHYLGAMLMQMGDLDSAYTELAHVSDQLCALGSRHFEVKARCDLGLLHHLAGDHCRAEQELTQVLALIESHGDLRFEALVSTRLAYALEANDQVVRAEKLYERGRLLHDQMGQTHYALNALAGLARLAEREGDNDAAFAHAHTIWEAIAGREVDVTTETARTLRTCYTIFSRQNDPRAADILETAVIQLRRRIATIDDPEQIFQFWQLVDHRFFSETVVGENMRSEG